MFANILCLGGKKEKEAAMGKVIRMSTMAHLQEIEVEYQPRMSMTDCEICLQCNVVEAAIATCDGIYREAECCENQACRNEAARKARRRLIRAKVRTQAKN
jgi:hypothetical protein